MDILSDAMGDYCSPYCSGEPVRQFPFRDTLSENYLIELLRGS